MQPILLAEFCEVNQRRQSIQVIVQRSLAATHFLRQRTIRLYLRYALLIRLHAPIEELAIVCRYTSYRDFDTSPVNMIVLRVTRGLLPVFFKIILALRDYVLDPS